MAQLSCRQGSGIDLWPRSITLYVVTRDRTANHKLREFQAMARASARHILVKDEALCESLKQQIQDGSDFAEVAKEHSDCPSGQQGGALGEFSPGQMVPEFDQVVFSAEVNQVHGPVQTQFGYHLIEITDRTD